MANYHCILVPWLTTIIYLPHGQLPLYTCIMANYHCILVSWLITAVYVSHGVLDFSVLSTLLNWPVKTIVTIEVNPNKGKKELSLGLFFSYPNQTRKRKRRYLHGPMCNHGNGMNRVTQYHSWRQAARQQLQRTHLYLHVFNLLHDT